MESRRRAEVLLVEDNEDHAFLAQKALEGEYKVELAASGEEGLSMIAKKGFDMVLLDYMLPDTDGLTVLSRIKQGRYDVPVVMVTVRGSKDLVAEAMRKGALDYIVKDKGYLANLPSVIRRGLERYWPDREPSVKEARPSVAPPDTIEKKKIALLKDMVSSQNDLIQPSRNPLSPCGYTYQEPRIILQVEAGQEIEHLEDLADMGCLERSFFDKIHLCPFCSQYMQNFREVCPACGSANVEVVEMVHHFGCAYVGPESEFKQGLEYFCPKCTKALRHVGVDYEKPGQSFLCHGCGHVFTEPDVDCLCMSCGEAFGVDRTVLRTIYTYKLTNKGVLAAERGELYEAGLQQVFLDSHLVLYTFRYFEERLAEELERSRRYLRPLSVMLLGLDNMEEHLARHGRAANASLLRDIALAIKEQIRRTDFPARYKEYGLAMILPETPVEGALAAAEKMRKRVEDINAEGAVPKITASIGLSCYSEEVDASRQMIDLASERLQEARRAGGNCVRF